MSGEKEEEELGSQDTCSSQEMDLPVQVKSNTIKTESAIIHNSAICVCDFDVCNDSAEFSNMKDCPDSVISDLGQEHKLNEDKMQTSQLNEYQTGNFNKIIERKDQSYILHLDSSVINTGAEYTILSLDSNQGYDEKYMYFIKNSEMNNNKVKAMSNNEELLSEDNTGKVSLEDVPVSDLPATWLPGCFNQGNINTINSSEDPNAQPGISGDINNSEVPVYEELQAYPSISVNDGDSFGQQNAVPPLISFPGLKAPPFGRNQNQNWGNTSWQYLQRYPLKGKENLDSMEGLPRYTCTTIGHPKKDSPSLVNMYGSTPYPGRDDHNAKERQRRSRIKLSCQYFRRLVPGLHEKTDKASVFEYTVHYLALLKQSTGGELDQDFKQKFGLL